MLVELHVRDLGVIEQVSVDLGPGLTALTGETGAGKTLIVEALELLLGGRADPVLVRPGADEALVEGRFEDTIHPDDAASLILARSVPAGGGRSRAWVDGRMAAVSALSESGAALVDLHGQHAQQSLLCPSAQLRALDTFAGIDRAPLDAMVAERRIRLSELERLGGDEQTRAREAELLAHQLSEIEAAGVEDPDEDGSLAEEEDRLSEAARYRETAAAALDTLESESADDGGAVDRLGRAAGALTGSPALQGLAARLSALQVETADVASELRGVLDGWEDDPERLAWVRARRQLLRELWRKYGDGVEGILAYADQARARLDELTAARRQADEHVVALEALDRSVAAESASLGAARRSAAPRLAAAVEKRMRVLAMPGARLEVALRPDDPGDEVTFLLGANPGEGTLPLAKVASGGELARAMLALRLVLSEAPPTMVFDEVDAGVGGEAALSVGHALAELAEQHQVVVVTHLAQVAAFADRHLVVRKEQRHGRTVAEVSAVVGEERVTELARMLSGRPGSATARRHAEELLSAAGEGVLHR